MSELAMGSYSSHQLSKESQSIQKEVKQHNLVVYSTTHCGYCTKAKKELNENGIPFTEKNFDKLAREDPTGAKAHMKGLIDLTNQKTVPQIFLCGKFIGGYTEMHALLPNLPAMLSECSTNSHQDNIKPKL